MHVIMVTKMTIMAIITHRNSVDAYRTKL